MESSEIVVREPSPELSKEISTVVEQAKGLSVINSNDDLMFAAEFQKQIKATIQKVEEFFDSDIKSAHDLHKSLVAKKKKFTEPLEQAVRISSQAIATYQFNQEQAARKEQERLQKEADRKGYAAPAIVPKPAKVEGITVTEIWRAVVVDLPALIKSVANGKIPMMAILPNEKFLNEQARSLKEHFNFPGCKVERELGTRTRI